LDEAGNPLSRGRTHRNFHCLKIRMGAGEILEIFGSKEQPNPMAASGRMRVSSSFPR